MIVSVTDFLSILCKNGNNPVINDNWKMYTVILDQYVANILILEASFLIILMWQYQ